MEQVDVLDAAHRAALSAGKPLVYVCPPAAWAVEPLFTALTPGPAERPATLILVPELAHAWDIETVLADAEALQPVLVVSGRARGASLLRAHRIRTVVAAAPDALALVRLAALKLDGLERLVIAWPESFDTEAMDALEGLLADARRAQRLVVTADPDAVEPFLSAHAHRAPVATVSSPPEHPLRRVRFATAAGPDERYLLLRAALDEIDPASARIWDPYPARHERWRAAAGGTDTSVEVGASPDGPPVDLAIALDCVSPEVLTRLQETARELLVLVRADQIPYLSRFVEGLSPFPHRSEADRARTRAHALRQRIRERARQGGLDAELVALAPLFHEMDPAVVAAAAAALTPSPTPAPEAPAWTRVRLNLGKSQRLGPGDVVGVLVNAVGIPRKHIGRIEIRDRHTTIEVRPDDLETVVRDLTGTVIRGHRATAREETP